MFFKTISRSYKIIKKKKKCIIITLLCTMFRINVILHWDSFGLRWGILVVFFWLFFPCLSAVPHSPLLSWIDFPFCAGWQCWFQPHAGCFVARSVFAYGGIPIQHARGSPWARRSPTSAAAPTPRRWTRRASDPLRTSVSTHVKV